MTTYTLSETSPINTVLTDPQGTVVYEVRTHSTLSKMETTITRQGQTLAIIQWKAFARSTLTMDGEVRFLGEAFPKPKALSTSRVYTTAGGQQLKWKAGRKLYCVASDTGLNIATYYRNAFFLFNNKKSTLDIAPAGVPLVDILITTWVIAEKKARDRRRSGHSSGGGGP